MAGPRNVLAHAASLVGYGVRRGARVASDHAAMGQLAWPAAHALPPGLRLTWLGTAGYRLDYQGTSLWIDPYLTRLPYRQFLGRRMVPPDLAALARVVDRADVVLVGHTHFDHALDAPAIAAAHGCPVFGSRSLVQLMTLSGHPELAREVEPYRRYQVGPFTFHFVPSVHSKLVLGLAISMGGELTCEHLDALTPRAYRCGQVWGIQVEVAGVRFYHQGSADLIDDAITDRGVDYFLCGIAGRRYTARFVERVLGRLDPAVVVASHFDDFFRPWGAPMGFSLNVNLTAFADEVAAVSRATPVWTLTPGQPVGAIE